MIAALAVEHLHGGDGLLQCPPLDGVGDVVVVEGQAGVVAAFDGLGDIAHEGVEGLGALHEADGEDELGVPLVVHLQRDVVLGEHVAGAEPELEGVAQVDGNGDVGGEAVVDGGLYGGLGGQDPGGAGEVHGHRVDVDARDGGAKLLQDVLGVEGRLRWRRPMKWVTASATKVPEPQAGSRTRWSSGSVTTSRTMVRASQSGV